MAGLKEGAECEFGGATVRMGADGVGLRADGTIAGAGITLDEGVRRLIASGVPPEVAFAAATERPAAALGLAVGLGGCAKPFSFFGNVVHDAGLGGDHGLIANL